ncbi:hypothetical protein KI387_005091, partial [Taxus chinensis]
MGLLDQLWDDVVAGPAPLRGLGKFRKSTSINTKSLPEGGGEDAETGRVTKSITIAKQYNRSLSMDDSPVPSPSSPVACSSPSSPSS